jgi:hypothetical protein
MAKSRWPRSLTSTNFSPNRELGATPLASAGWCFSDKSSLMTFVLLQDFFPSQASGIVAISTYF